MRAGATRAIVLSPRELRVFHAAPRRSPRVTMSSTAVELSATLSSSWLAFIKKYIAQTIQRRALPCAGALHECAGAAPAVRSPTRPRGISRGAR